MNKKILLFFIMILVGTAFWQLPVFAEQNTGEEMEILQENPDEMEILEEEAEESEILMPLETENFFTEEIEVQNETGIEEGFCESDSDTMLSQYLDRELLGIEPKIMLRSIHLGDRLSETNNIIYTALKQNAESIAAGEKTDTILTISMAGSSLKEKKWFAEDLGIESIGTLEDGKFVPAADFKAAFYAAAEYSISETMVSLLRDCPYEMFWFGKTYSSTVFYRIFSKSDGTLYAMLPQSVKVSICASPDYAVRGEGAVKTLSYIDEDGTEVFYDPYTINAERMDAVHAAVANARQIVAENTCTNDYDTLFYYFSTVSGLSAYNSAAVSKTHPYPGGYGDPWQLVYLFDGDPQTKVVCEGFAKGMQVLCDMTEFKSSSVYCYSVTGELIHTATGADRGFHMWNTVHMEDGCNYLIDATNSKAGDPWAFLAPYSAGNVTEGYTVSSRYTYIYDQEYTWLVYTEEDLTLADLPYIRSRTPYNLTASGSGGSIVLKWKCDWTPDGYLISRSEDGERYFDVGRVSDGSTLSWVDEDSLNGVYYYRVCAYLIRGGREKESSFSVPASACALTAPVLQKPENSATAIKFTWSENEKADGYKLYYSVNGGDYQWIKTIQSPSILSWTGLSKNTKDGDRVKVRIRAYKELNGKICYSPYSTVKKVIRLEKRTIDTVKSIASGVKLTWDRSKAADGYVIYRSIDGGTYQKVNKITDNRTVSWTDKNAVKAGKKYSYKVLSYIKWNNTTYLSYPSAVRAVKK